jgi:hypothetical protein
MSRTAVHLYRHLQSRRSRAEIVRRPVAPDRFATAHALGWRPRP